MDYSILKGFSAKLAFAKIRLFSAMLSKDGFDRAFYAKTYPDVHRRWFLHYLLHGADELRSPNQHFNPVDYRAAFPDVDELVPRGFELAHYVSFGRRENSEPYVSPSVAVGPVVTKNSNPLNAQLFHLQRTRYDVLAKNGERRIAFFSAITGGFDCLRVPTSLNPKIDYFIFTDSQELDVPAPLIKVVLTKHEADPRRLARYVKMGPFRYFADKYDIAIWADANILLKTDLEHYLFEFEQSGADVGSFMHPKRRAVEAEFLECALRRKDRADVVQAQLAEYKRSYDLDSIDRAYALSETNILLTNLRSDVARIFYSIWCSQIMRHSLRDQLSYSVSAAQAGLKIYNFKGHPLTCPRLNSYEFALYEHGNIANPLAANLINGSETCIKDHDIRSPSSLWQGLRPEADGPTLAIVVPVHNAFDYFELLLTSISAQDAPRDMFEVIIVDDASDLDLRDFLGSRCAENWRVIRNDQNLGYTYSVLEGFHQTEAPLVTILNSDTILPADFVTSTLKIMAASSWLDIVGPLSNAASYQTVCDPGPLPSVGSASALEDVSRCQNELQEVGGDLDVSTLR